MRGREVRCYGRLVHRIEDDRVTRFLDETQLSAKRAGVLGDERLQNFHFVRAIPGLLLERGEFHRLISLQTVCLAILGFAVDQLLFQFAELAGERQPFLLHFLARRRQFGQRLLQIVRGAGRDGFQILSAQVQAERQRQRKKTKNEKNQMLHEFWRKELKISVVI